MQIKVKGQQCHGEMIVLATLRLEFGLRIDFFCPFKENRPKTVLRINPN